MCPGTMSSSFPNTNFVDTDALFLTFDGDDLHNVGPTTSSVGDTSGEC